MNIVKEPQNDWWEMLWKCNDCGIIVGFSLDDASNISVTHRFSYSSAIPIDIVADCPHCGRREVFRPYDGRL